jgi:hypothetical protein
MESSFSPTGLTEHIPTAYLSLVISLRQLSIVIDFNLNIKGFIAEIALPPTKVSSLVYK